MFSLESPYMNIPVGISPERVLFLDGLRHVAQMAGLSYGRLCRLLSDRAAGLHTISSDVEIFSDAWAFVDSMDRFRHIWWMQPDAPYLIGDFSKCSVREALDDVRAIRNLASHRPQNFNSDLTNRTSATGVLSWVSRVDQGRSIRTCYIRSGIFLDEIGFNFEIPSQVEFPCEIDSVEIKLTLGSKSANLDRAHAFLCSAVRYSEDFLFDEFRPHAVRYPADIYASAELNWVAK